MRGVHAAPRDLPPLRNELYGLSEEEWLELGVSFAYGQRASRREDLEEVREFRRFYRAVLETEGTGVARASKEAERRKGGERGRRR